MKYNVTYTISEVGSVDVEADDPDEAMDIARETVADNETYGNPDHIEFDYPPLEYELDENIHRSYKR